MTDDAPKRSRSKAVITAKERRAILSSHEHPNELFRKIIRKFSSGGMTRLNISKVLDISYVDLLGHYSVELDGAGAEAVAAVEMNMHRLAISKDKQAGKVGMDWLERRGGEDWKKPAQKLIVDDESNKPPIIDSSTMSAEDRETLRQILLRQIKGPDEPEDPVTA